MLKGQWSLLDIQENGRGAPSADKLYQISVYCVSRQELCTSDSESVSAKSLPGPASGVNVFQFVSSKLSAVTNGPNSAILGHAEACRSRKEMQARELLVRNVLEEGPQVVEVLDRAMIGAEMIVRDVLS